MIRTILGISVGVAGAFCILASELLFSFPQLGSYRAYLAILLAVLALVVWFSGWHQARQRLRESDEQENFSIARDLRYWGVMFLLLAGISLFIQPFRRHKLALAANPVQPTSLSAKVMPPTPAPTPAPAEIRPPDFPRLNIQGYVLRANESVVFIAGGSYGIGDEVLGMSVKSVAREGVTMEKGGRTKLYPVP